MDVICDIDGTVANHGHRLHFIENHPKSWTKFYAACIDDPPLVETADLIKCLAASGCRILWCTGRPESVRTETTVWLVKNELWRNARLYMRATDDYRPDMVVKAELLQVMRQEGFSPVVAFEDRSRCVRTWRELGLTCYQVADGDY